MLLVFLSAAPHVQAAQLMDIAAVEGKLLALTIEDVETSADMQTILTLCERFGARVTFFTAAKMVEENLPVIKQAVSAGHEFGNHGLRHTYWGETGAAEIKKELVEADAILRKATGRSARLFKPPYHYYEANYIEAVSQFSPQGVIVRGVDLADWTLMSPEAVLDKAKSSVVNGGIIQLNYKVRQAAEALPAMLEQLTKMGYSFISVSELQAKAALPQISKPQPVPRTPLKPGYYGVVNHVNVSRPAVALTFDDGGKADQVQAIVDILKVYQARATFFLLGHWVNENPDLVRRIAADGHELANHSYSHPRFTWLTANEIRQEVQAAQTALTEASGQAASALFRPPYGSYNGEIIKVVKELGYEAIVMWDIDTRDWSGVSAGAISNHVLERVTPGSVVLFHLHGANTVEALEKLIPTLQNQGYKLSTVGEMLNS